MKHDIFYKAMLARDYRFDGKFFIGVKTTGIYCRPICPAKPKRKNVEFFLTSAAAEKSGYRPCLRCRPESAPLSPAWYGKSAIVQRALRTISNEGFFDLNEDRFAAQFGVTARHLRRLFVEEIGQTPKKIAFDNRLNFARKLIVETQLPITSIAMTAGFRSLRRFNDAFKKRFHRAPRLLRKKNERHDSGISLELSYRPPLDWQSLLAFYRSHQIVGVENITESTDERVFKIGKSVGFVEVSPVSGKPKLRAKIFTEDPSILFSLTQRIRQMFDLDSDPLLIANVFESHAFLNSLAKKYPGLRLARGWDPFETSICTILGQLVSLAQARMLVQHLVIHYGEKVIHPVTGGVGFLFPEPHVLANSDLAACKTTSARKRAIREFASMVSQRKLELAKPQDIDLVKNRLLSISGIGAWSAEYIALRALGHTDAMPETDLILKRALNLHTDIDLEKLRPWRSYAAIYLWKHYAQRLSKQKKRMNL